FHSPRCRRSRPPDRATLPEEPLDPARPFCSLDGSKLGATVRAQTRSRRVSMSGEPFIRVRGVQSDRTIGAEERTARLPPGHWRWRPPPRTDNANLLLLLLRQGFGRRLGLRPGDALAHVLAAVVVHRGSHAHVHREPLARLAAIHAANRRHVAVVA